MIYQVERVHPCQYTPRQRFSFINNIPLLHGYQRIHAAEYPGGIPQEAGNYLRALHHSHLRALWGAHVRLVVGSAQCSFRVQIRGLRGQCRVRVWLAWCETECYSRGLAYSDCSRRQKKESRGAIAHLKIRCAHFRESMRGRSYKQVIVCHRLHRCRYTTSKQIQCLQTRDGPMPGEL
jgi:hypothetical protein